MTNFDLYVEKNRQIAEEQHYTYIYNVNSPVFHTKDCIIGLRSAKMCGAVYYENQNIKSRCPCKTCKPTPELSPSKEEYKAVRKADAKKSKAEKMNRAESYPMEVMMLFADASGSYTNGAFYRDFFLKAGASYNDLKELFRQQNAELFYTDPHSVGIWLNDDCWQIVMNGKELLLYHNNYKVNDDYTRTFFDGYHQQRLLQPVTFRAILRYITGYSWQDHVNAMKGNAQVEESRRQQLNAVRNRQKIRNRNPFFSTYLFVDTSSTAFETAKQKLFFIPRVVIAQIENTDYSIVYCLVPKIFEKKFLRLMESLKEKCLQEKKFSYTAVCEENIAQNETEQEKMEVSLRSGLISIIPPRMILNNRVSITTK